MPLAAEGTKEQPVLMYEDRFNGAEAEIKCKLTEQKQENVLPGVFFTL
ncbi:hypothetical protein HMPREF0201_00975 [Cedecea davisae DSM 4568]|uniref:Uncharacterized protein n=1 Tax=Cedecea davisae DSM 4568 TaxID=566551 RepID=S3J0U2_9ENTR|nr:hypothetical protein HMPREF0201_00975 [Cedecea davisae DSM 4568]